MRNIPALVGVAGMTSLVACGGHPTSNASPNDAGAFADGAGPEVDARATGPEAASHDAGPDVESAHADASAETDASADTDAPVSSGPGGLLDPTFGAGGQVTTSFTGYDTRAHALVLQPDGKIVVAGTSYDPSPSSGAAVALARYDGSGAIDPDFGAAGTVRTPLGQFFNIRADGAQSVALQPDGKIVVAGGMTAPGNSERVAVVRYNGDGTVDTSFGGAGTGVATTSVLSLGPGAFASAVVVQGDGKIAVAGSSFVLARFDPDGTPDSTLQSTASCGPGCLTTSFGTGWSDEATALLLQPDGKLVSVGDTLPQYTFYKFALARYQTNGALDPTFGAGGTTTTAFSGVNGMAFAAARRPDGKLIVLGPNILARYNSDGSLDTTFGTAGSYAVDAFSGYAIALQSDGKILTGGDYPGTAGGSPTTTFAVHRHNSDGTVDTTFGSGLPGLVEVPFSTDSMVSGIALQTDGKIVAAGTAMMPPAQSGGDFVGQFAVARLLP